MSSNLQEHPAPPTPKCPAQHWPGTILHQKKVRNSPLPRNPLPQFLTAVITATTAPQREGSKENTAWTKQRTGGSGVKHPLLMLCLSYGARRTQWPPSQAQQLGGQCISPSDLMSCLPLKRWKQVGRGAPGTRPNRGQGKRRQGHSCCRHMASPTRCPEPPQLRGDVFPTGTLYSFYTVVFLPWTPLPPTPGSSTSQPLVSPSGRITQISVLESGHGGDRIILGASASSTYRQQLDREPLIEPTPNCFLTYKM